ncbi:MAG: lytic transglycosylase domain-containing protein, partial [Alphaproteobacteria bacterium]|nr:lytic transglycosylase domain-containing protein [Alphaproteobacteria bacterium]
MTDICGTNVQALNRLHFRPRILARASGWHLAFDKAASLTLGLLITLTFAIAIQKTLPQRAHLPALFNSLHARVEQVFAQPQAHPVETVVVQAEPRLSSAQLIARWQPYVIEASQRFSVPAAWIDAVMRQESGGRDQINGKPIQSRAGALGLMQLLPDTYRQMQARYRLGANVADPHDNILAGTAYLRALYHQYGFPFMFAAYNAGPGQFERSVAAGRRLPAETRAYVSGILRHAEHQPLIETAVRLPRSHVLKAAR